MGYPREDLVGKCFGKLTVVSFAGRRGRHSAYWNCLCGCGNRSTVKGASLKTETRSCGCLRIEKFVERNKARAKPGVCDTPTYRSWAAMLSRCSDKDPHKQKYYGSKGIQVCVRWRGENGFVNFLADMGPRPTGMWIERKNGKRGYSPGNCRWATRFEQMENRSITRWVSLNGERMSLTRACRLVGAKYCTVRHRMVNQGMSFRQAAQEQFRGRVVSRRAA
jgi:hypothetical protein